MKEIQRYRVELHDLKPNHLKIQFTPQPDGEFVYWKDLAGAADEPEAIPVQFSAKEVNDAYEDGYAAGTGAARYRPAPPPVASLDDRMLRLPAGRWSIDVCFSRGEPEGVLSFNAKHLDTMEQCECFSMAAAIQWLEGRLSPTKPGSRSATPDDFHHYADENVASRLPDETRAAHADDCDCYSCDAKHFKETGHYIHCGVYEGTQQGPCSCSTVSETDA